MNNFSIWNSQREELYVKVVHKNYMDKWCAWTCVFWWLLIAGGICAHIGIDIEYAVWSYPIIQIMCISKAAASSKERDEFYSKEIHMDKYERNKYVGDNKYDNGGLGHL